MQQSWRWYGPKDPVLLEHIRQAGATHVVSALHETYEGQEWTPRDIEQRRDEIADAGLVWNVVESIPVHPSIKLGATDAAQYIAAYKATIQNLAAAGLKTICYNFMPVVDWTRTDLRYPAPNGGLALRFDFTDFAAYDLFILKRENANQDYSETVITTANARFKKMTNSEITRLEQTIIAGLPGSELSHDRESIRRQIAQFDGLDAAQLQANLITFLRKIIPVAQSVGVNMCLHPDDPPIPLFGMPRVVSTADDFRALFNSVPSLANGITFCAGSLGSRPDNDLAGMAREFAERIHFTHLRNVRRQGKGSFFESDHLDGDVDMIKILSVLLDEEKRRQNTGQHDWEIPMRPDHGHLLIDDIRKQTNPGYSTIGRLKGLAELRGVIKALESVR